MCEHHNYHQVTTITMTAITPPPPHPLGNKEHQKMAITHHNQQFNNITTRTTATTSAHHHRITNTSQHHHNRTTSPHFHHLGASNLWRVVIIPLFISFNPFNQRRPSVKPNVGTIISFCISNMWQNTSVNFVNPVIQHDSTTAQRSAKHHPPAFQKPRLGGFTFPKVFWAVPVLTPWRPRALPPCPQGPLWAARRSEECILTPSLRQNNIGTPVLSPVRGLLISNKILLNTV